MATMHGADPAFAANVQAMIAASGGRLRLVSGVRNTAHQTRLWNAALAKYGSAAKARKWVAPPGRSNHEKGIAVDLGGDLAWAKANAHRFGLHQALANEPWHYEPIGSRAGKAKTHMGLPTNAAASAQHQERINPRAPEITTTTIGAEAPTEDRRNLSTQLFSLLNILDKPIDFNEGKVA